MRLRTLLLVAIGAVGAVAATIWSWRRRDQALLEPQTDPTQRASDNPVVKAVVPAGRLSGRYAVARSATHTHRGIDIAAAEGAAVHTPQDGVVVGVWPDCERSGYGNSILIEHDRVYTFYAHLQEASVAAGDVVKAGDRIGAVGATNCGINRPMAPHLHFEVHTSLVGRRRRPVINENNPRRMDPEVYLEQLWQEDAVQV